MKIDLTRNNMLNKLMIFKSNRKKGGGLSFSGKRSCLKRIRGCEQGRREVEVAILLLSNGKNNVTAKNVLSYF